MRRKLENTAMGINCAGRLGILVTTASLCTGCGASDDADRRPPPLDLNLESTVLDNQLEVVVHSDHSLPLVTVLVAFRAGAFVEGPEINGYSHLLEHMMFKGSADVPDAVEFRQRLDALGIVSNATTSDDRVTFFYILQREHLEQGVELMAGALQEPILAEEEVAREIDVVLAEYDLAEADHDFLHYRAMVELLFPTHMSRKNPIGTRDVLLNATSADLQALHATYYIPNNALLVLSGDVTPEEGFSLATRRFGNWQTGPDPFATHPVPEHPEVEGGRAAIVTAPVDSVSLTMAWQGPDTRRDRGAVFAGDVLAQMVFQRDHPFRSLVNPDLALSAGMGSTHARYTGIISASTRLAPGNEMPVVEAMLFELRTIADPSTTERLDAAKDEIWRRWFSFTDDPTAVAFAVANEWGAGDLDFFETYLDDVFAVDGSDIRRFAERYLTRTPDATVLSTSPEHAADVALTAEFIERWLR